jgi:hypothetical protein
VAVRVDLLRDVLRRTERSKNGKTQHSPTSTCCCTTRPAPTSRSTPPICRKTANAVTATAASSGRIVRKS